MHSVRLGICLGGERSRRRSYWSARLWSSSLFVSVVDSVFLFFSVLPHPFSLALSDGQMASAGALLESGTGDTW
jgi:hypothetical protein